MTSEMTKMTPFSPQPSPRLIQAAGKRVRFRRFQRVEGLQMKLSLWNLLDDGKWCVNHGFIMPSYRVVNSELPCWLDCLYQMIPMMGQKWDAIYMLSNCVLACLGCRARSLVMSISNQQIVFRVQIRYPQTMITLQSVEILHRAR